MDKIVSYNGRNPARITKLVVGGRYKCDPLNARATKNRGRVGVMLCYGSEGTKIEWDDTKRKSNVNIADFIHEDDFSKSKEQIADEAKQFILSRIREEMDEKSNIEP